MRVARLARAVRPTHLTPTRRSRLRRRADRSRRHPLGRWIALAWTVGIVTNGLRLRSRLSHLPVLDTGVPDHAVPHEDRTAPATGDLADGETGPAPARLPGGGEGEGQFVLLTAPGVVVDDVTRRAAVRFARTEGLDVVDLVPGDLPVGPLLELVRMVDPKTYRHDRLAPGRSAGHATLVRTDLADRLDPGRPTELDPVMYAEAIMQLKRCAPTSTDLVLAPNLRAVATDSSWRLPRLRALVGGVAPVATAGPGLSGLLVGLVAALGRPAGATTAIAAVAQPVVATAGLPAKPRDRSPWALLTRPARDVVASVRAFRAPRPLTEQARRAEAATAREARRISYAELLANQPGFLEPRRGTCPWCGSGDLHHLLTVPDLLQHKPGRFGLDECYGCGHVFQNPRLSIEGLDFYYRDFYDGLGNETTELFFSRHRRLYRDRAALVAAVSSPKRWLDVGTGYGHFCLVAQEVLPDTRFDGLDLGDSVLDAQRRGWIDQAHHGLLPDLAGELAGAYDVVSMHHYLEHTREPFEELDAARTVLEAGGHLLVEVPDPESRLSRRLGWASVHWFQPQHQHLIPLGNLTQALADRGFTLVAAQRGEAHQRHDLAAAAGLVANRLAPPGDEPWLPPSTPTGRAARAAVMAAFAPVAAAGLALDHAMAPLLCRMRHMTNAYRVLARRD